MRNLHEQSDGPECDQGKKEGIEKPAAKPCSPAPASGKESQIAIQQNDQSGKDEEHPGDGPGLPAIREGGYGQLGDQKADQAGKEEQGCAAHSLGRIIDRSSDSNQEDAA